MSPLAIVLQGVIVGVALVVVFVLGAGTAVVDYRRNRARHLAAVSRICDACDGTGDSTGADWCEECSGTGRELDDPGEAWDDAHDRWTDGQLGVA